MNSVNTPIRTGIVGYGTAGRVFHAPPIASDEAYSLDAIVTRDPERARLAQQEHPDARVLPSVDQLWELELDLVVVGTPPVTHVDLAGEALERGVAVVVDKPFVIDPDEGARLIARADELGVPLTVFQNRRWDADFLTLRRLIDDGRLGRVHRFESRFEWWKPELARSWKAESTVEQGGGILYDLGPHLLDQALQLFGPAAEVSAEVLTRRPDGVADDDVFVALTHESGTVSHLWMNGLAPRKGPRFHVVGAKAGYSKWHLDGQEDFLKGGGSVTDPEYGVEGTSSWGVLGVGHEEQRVEPERGQYPQFYTLLADALLRGGPLPVNPRDALEALQIIARIHAEHPRRVL
ncbi:Gfo/Idh/MocA family protein [Nesterenkonia suensis]